MPPSDDKPRGASVREASRLRATLGSEPSSGYAFHDQVRVDRVRPGQRDNTTPQAASHAPRERGFARTLVGGVTIQEALAEQAIRTEPCAAPDNDQQEPAARISWPPMPQVPSELAGSLMDTEIPAGAGPNVKSSTPASAKSSSLPASNATSSPPAVPEGGAIWQAMPSLVAAPITVTTVAEPLSAPPPRSVPARSNSRPAGYRPSAAELEAEYAHVYGDQRVLKYEALVERNAWEQLAEELGREADLSPALQLLHVIAQREMLKGDQKQAAALLAQQGISAMARLLNLPEASPTALVLGKRLLRRNPGWTPKRKASTRLSIGLLLAGLGAGTAIGWLITTLLF